LAVLGFELRASHLLGRSSTTGAAAPALLLFLVYLFLPLIVLYFIYPRALFLGADIFIISS
jgi:hypothetical protein